MSRWREMVMDYGKILEDKTSHASSFSTLGRDLEDKRSADLELRRVLEVHFRPLFQRFVYGGERIACHDLRRILRDTEYRDRLPPEKVHELADLAEFNSGRAVTYEEFASIVLGKSNFDDLTSYGSQMDLRQGRPPGRFAKVLGSTCRNTMPQQQLTGYLSLYKCLPPPFFMILVVLAQIIVYIVYAAEENVTNYPLNGIPPNNTLMYTPSRRREAWRYISYWLLHQGYIDLIFNIVIQVFLGIPLEIVFSWWRMAIVFFCGVISGSLGQSLTDHYVGIVGAAGGAYAIVGAHLVAVFQNRKIMNDSLSESKTKRILCSLILRVLLIIMIMIPQCALAVYRRWFYENIPIKCGIATYVGGLVSGALLSEAFMKDNKRYPWQHGYGLFSLATFFVFIGGCIVFNIAWDGYPEEDYS